MISTRQILNTVIVSLCLSLMLTRVADALTASPYEDVKLETSTGTLHGTIKTPVGQGPFPIALILPGSGDVNRDGNGALFYTDMYVLLADGLAKNGIASLRIDKRGYAESVGALKRFEDLRFEMFRDDAVAWLKWLSKDTRFGKQYIIGHSEGSLVGILAAQRISLAGFVSLAGPGRNFGDLILEQCKDKTPKYFDECQRLVRALQSNRRISDFTLPSGVSGYFSYELQPYLISLFKYDPIREIKKLTMPSIIIQGTTDVQMYKLDAINLASAIQKAPIFIEGMNHILKLAELDLASQVATYTNPRLPIPNELFDVIAKFIREN